MLYAIVAVIVLAILAKFFTRTFWHLIGLLAVEILLFIFFPTLLVKLAQLVAFVRHSLP